MIFRPKISVAVNGYGVIGKRVAAAIRLQDDMELAGVADIGADWRFRLATNTSLGIDDIGAALAKANSEITSIKSTVMA